MAELAHFKNFAKLKDTSIEFNDITVLAGKPGTGKSYVMKYFYAINDMFYQKSRNKLIDNNQDLSSILSSLEFNYSINPDIGYLYNLFDEKLYKELYEEISKKWDFSYRGDTLESLENIIYKNNLSLNRKMGFYLNNLIKSIFINHTQISNFYQVKYQDIVFKYQDDEFIINLDNKKLFSKVEESIFVETPLILEFKKFIPKEKGKTPYHIESLLSVLDTDYSFTNIEQEQFIKNFRKKSKAIIDGDIENIGNSFIFNRKDDKNYDILNASSGIKSIGLLQYLVTNKALKKGSILFWEEPEVHLHPSWQRLWSR